MLNEPLGTLHPSPQPVPFFRVMVKNEERGLEGSSCLNKVYVRLPETNITLLRGRRTLVSPIFCSTLLRLPGPASACPMGCFRLVLARSCSLQILSETGSRVLQVKKILRISMEGRCGSLLEIFLTLGYVYLFLQPHLPGWRSTSHSPSNTF